MMKDNSESGTEPLSALLRGARPAPPLPPGFQPAVWRRLEAAQAAREMGSLAEWMDRAVAWLLRPRMALAGVAAMLLVGTSIGILQGANLANALAKQQYLSAVSPLASR